MSNAEPRIFDILRNSAEPAADQALVAGLTHVEPNRQTEIVEILLHRSREAGLTALPDAFDKLEPVAQSLTVANTARLFAALRNTIRSPNLQTRLNTLEIIRRSQNPRLSYLAAAAVHDGSTHIRAEAGTTLRQLTELHCRCLAETTAALQDVLEHDRSLTFAVLQTLRLLAEEREQLLGAVREALGSYESHHRTEVLKAAMYVADELEQTLFEEGPLKRGKLTHAMLEVFATAPIPQLAPFAYIALGHPDLRKRIAAILAQLTDVKFFTEFIRCQWLARDERIRANLPAIRSITWLEDRFDAAFNLPPEVAALTPAWLLTLGLPTDQKVALLRNFLLIENPDANRAAVWALVRIATPGSTVALTSVLDHEDASLRRIAELELAHRRRQDAHRANAPRADRPTEWSALLDACGLNEDFEDFWQNLERLSADAARSGGRHAPIFLPAFNAQLQTKLCSSHTTDRQRAVRLLTGLYLASHYARDMFNAANDPADEVRAAAMPALGQIADATSRRILERALNDESPLVQAAAIDAMDAMNAPRRAELILPKTRTDDAGVRAAAVRALLKMHLPQAAVALAAMLHDPRPDHRSSALWVADQLQLVAIAPRVAELARKDPDLRIARIAQHVSRRLERAAGTGHGGPHSSGSAPQPNWLDPTDAPDAPQPAAPPCAPGAVR